MPSNYLWFALFNRPIGIAIFWITALLIHLRRKALERLQHTHAELEVKTERLIEAERLKTEFLADTSHELRAPLAIIKSHIDLALGKRSLGLIDPYDSLAGINTEVTHISQLIADLILLSRSVSGPHRIMVRSELDLKEIIAGVAQKYQNLADNKRVAIISHLPALKYHGDAEKLEKLFSNLLGNAIQYGKENGIIEIIAREDAGFILIEFKDDGIGIPESDLPYIFDRFYRVEKARTRSSGGVGLGLAICKWIVEAHGGTKIGRAHV